jgi:hypothetical protein
LRAIVISLDNEPPEVELGDPPVAEADRRARWTFGRVATDLAIIAFAVPFVMDTLEPAPRGECGTTFYNLAKWAGFWFLIARLFWLLPRG